MKQKTSESTKRRNRELNTWFIGKDIGMNTINKQQKWGCLIQKGQLKTIGQEFQVEIYKREE